MYVPFLFHHLPALSIGSSQIQVIKYTYVDHYDLRERITPFLFIVNPNVAEIPANAPFVIPVKPVLDLIGERESIFLVQAWIPFFTGMTGNHKKLTDS
jgi:hypothetical protein